ncbi:MULTISPECIES: fibronectin type III domain-containing protein [Flavobacterium]|uniref:fibronectin type III domain-containing protein n=1 Tax=Flavobacterium TaxID=237 RepID=UPI001182265F|nr:MULTISPECIES: fibronectin type III domain-containing protein [Flavobacterium]MCR4030734.1 fibronectin type III domain-containing protein [Flavobacterium panacis]
MGSLLQNTVFGKSNYKVNTYIGGIGPSINNPVLLANKLGIAVNRIKLFRVIDNDIECAIIGGMYEVKGFNHTDVSQITYYRDPTGIVSGIGPQGFYNTGLIEGYFPNATYISVAAFDQNLYPSGKPKNLLKKLYIPSVTKIGNTTLNESVFRSGNLNAGKIWANPILQTINSGGVEGDLAFLATGNTIVYVNDFTKPDNITNLSATSIYNTGIQLSFTPPNSINGIDWYEVYVNGIYKQDIKNSGDIISGLTKNTNYNINLIAVDNLHNKSVSSATLNFTTGNINLDVDAENFITSSQNHKYIDIINNLVVSLKTNNLWNKIQAAYPFVGSTQVNHKFNLKNPLDTNSAFRLVFNGGGTHSVNGYQTNGSNAYANTFLNVNTYHTFSNAGLTIVCGTNNVPTTTNSFDFGAQKSSSPWECYQIHLNHGASKNNNVFVVGTVGLSKTAVNNAKGIHTISKTTNTEASYSKNGNFDTTIAGTQTGIVPALPYFIGCLNNGGSPYGYSNQRIQFIIIHEGLSNEEVKTLHTIIDAFENSLGRKTW